MAQLYTGPHFWDPRCYDVTARSKPGRYSSRSLFIESVNKWMDKHKMKYRWTGESTHTIEGVVTYQYSVSIHDEKDRTLFALRWS